MGIGNKPVIVAVVILSVISTIFLISSQNVEASLLSIPNTLVGFWPANGNANDATGHGHNGNIIGSVAFGPGVSGGAFVFNGLNGSVKVGSLGINNTNAPFSIIAWINPAKTSITGPAFRTIVQEGSTPPIFFIDQFMVGLGISPSSHPGAISLEIGGTQTYSQLAYTNSTVQEGKWTFVVATYDGSRTPGGMSIYINGIKQPLSLVGSGFTNSEISRDQWSIGSQGYANYPYYNNFKGSIDNVRIYSCALSGNDVHALFHGINVINCS